MAKTNSPAVSLINNGLGYVPPHDDDMEQLVIGCMLLDTSATIIGLDMLRADSFYNPKYQAIFSIMVGLFSEGIQIDMVTVMDQLHRKFPLLIHVAEISSYTQRIGSVAGMEYYCRIVAEYHIRRQLINNSHEQLVLARDMSNDALEVLQTIDSKFQSVMDGYVVAQMKSAKELVMESIQEIENAMNQPSGLSGTPSGFKVIDSITSGWQRSDLIVIAARPAMGKTAFMLAIARNCAIDFSKAVAIFSLEMSSVQLMKRLISSESSIASNRLISGELSDADLLQVHNSVSRKLMDSPIFIDDTGALSITEFRSKLTKLKLKSDVQLAIVDYLQLMTVDSPSGNREQEISTISRSLKQIAKDLNIPIIALSQLSRSVETRGGDKRPQLSDLRESGAIEQDADVVGFLYRPEYYGILTNEEGETTIGQASLIIAKHRNGSLGDCKMRFIPQFTRFEPIEDYSDKTSNQTSFDPDQGFPVNNFTQDDPF